jgi:hypothetical protein
MQSFTLSQNLKMTCVGFLYLFTVEYSDGVVSGQQLPKDSALISVIYYNVRLREHQSSECCVIGLQLRLDKAECMHEAVASLSYHISTLCAARILIDLHFTPLNKYNTTLS